MAEPGADRDRTAIIILAAGSSSRMGESKQHLLIDGEPLLVRCVDAALKSGVGIVGVVLGFQEDANRALLAEKPVEIISNPQWQAGIGSSLKAGLKHFLSKNSKPEAVLVMVGDQPLLNSGHLQRLVDVYRNGKTMIVASVYSGTEGVPALFNHAVFEDILAVGDNEGAKRIIQKYQPVKVDFKDGAVDLDTPEDYRNFIRQFSK